MNPHDPKTAVVFDAEKIVGGQLDCGDNSCEFIFLIPRQLRGGMRTNGGCRCLSQDQVYASTFDPPMAGQWVYTKAAIQKLRRFIRLCARTIHELDEAHDKLIKKTSARLLEQAEKIRKLETQLARHDQQGGILMPCKHPVQCAYPDGPDGKPSCLMCDQDRKIHRLEDDYRWVQELWTEGARIYLEDPDPCNDSPIILDQGPLNRRRYPRDWDLFIKMSRHDEGELLPEPDPRNDRTRRGDPIR